MSIIQGYSFCSDYDLGLKTILRDPSLRTVTVFCSPLSKVKTRIRLTRRADQIIITSGLNYADREYLQLCKRAKTRPRKLLLKYKKGD